MPELNVQNGVLKSLSFLFEYIGEMGKDYIYAVTPLLEDALMDRWEPTEPRYNMFKNKISVFFARVRFLKPRDLENPMLNWKILDCNLPSTSSSVADLDVGSGASFTPGSGSGISFFRISDPGSGVPDPQPIVRRTCNFLVKNT